MKIWSGKLLIYGLFLVFLCTVAFLTTREVQMHGLLKAAPKLGAMSIVILPMFLVFVWVKGIFGD